MIKRLLALLILCSTYTVSLTQPYNSILGDSSIWFVTNCFFGCSTDPYFATDDTIFGTYSYKILDGFHFNRKAFIREDSVNKKFYYRQLTGFRANEDILIYDFNLKVGDSMILYNPNTPLRDSAGYFTLDSIVSISILTGNRRKYYLSGPDFGTGVKTMAEWIEGVGSTFMINTGGGAADLNDHGELSCFYNDTTHVYESSFASNYGDCFINTVGILESIAELKMPEVYPNPSTGNFNIKVPSVFGGLISFSNLNGEIIHAINIFGSDNIEVCFPSSIKDGIYFMRFEFEERMITKKIIIQRK